MSLFNRGEWVDVEKHNAPIRFEIEGVIIDRLDGVVVFQKHSRTGKKRAVIKAQGYPNSVKDADVAEMLLGITVNWPE